MSYTLIFTEIPRVMHWRYVTKARPANPNPELPYADTLGLGVQWRNSDGPFRPHFQSQAYLSTGEAGKI